MKHSHVIATLCAVLALCTAAPVLASPSKAVLHCMSEDDGEITLRLDRDSQGNYEGVSAPFSLNPSLKMRILIQGAALIRGTRYRAAGINACAVEANTALPQVCAGFGTIFDAAGYTGFHVFGRTGITDPEGLFCDIQLSR